MTGKLQRDRYAAVPETRCDPSEDCMIVTPSPDELPMCTRAIRVEGGGMLEVVMCSGRETSLYFKDGETRSICVDRILSASDTVQVIEVMM